MVSSSQKQPYSQPQGIMETPGGGEDKSTAIGLHLEEEKAAVFAEGSASQPPGFTECHGDGDGI